MVYIPITRGTIKKMGDMTEIGLFKSFSRNKDWALVCPSLGVMTFVDGQGVGTAAPTKAVVDVVGLAIESVVIEVDDESIIDTNQFKLPRGMIIKTSDGWSIPTHMLDDSYGHGHVVDYVGSKKDVYREAIGYTKWRILIEEAGELKVLLEVEAGETINID